MARYSESQQGGRICFGGTQGFVMGGNEGAPVTMATYSSSADHTLLFSFGLHRHCELSQELAGEMRLGRQQCYEPIRKGFGEGHSWAGSRKSSGGLTRLWFDYKLSGSLSASHKAMFPSWTPVPSSVTPIWKSPWLVKFSDSAWKPPWLVKFSDS